MNDMLHTSGTSSTAPRGTEFLGDGGDMGARIRAHDWLNSPLGDPSAWSQTLRTLVGVMLGAAQPMFIAWGPEQTLLYNDGYAPLLGGRHPAALGRPFFDVWPEVRSDLTPLFDRVFGGEPVHMDDIALVLERNGRPEEAHFAFSYTPVRDERGSFVGLFCPCTETTEQVLAHRRHLAERERLQMFFEQAPGFMAMLRGPEHVFEFVNPAYMQPPWRPMCWSSTTMLTPGHVFAPAWSGMDGRWRPANAGPRAPDGTPLTLIDHYIPLNLTEQLMLQDAMNGGGSPIMEPMNFPLGGQKYQSSQNGITLHYMCINGICGDFKFKGP